MINFNDELIINYIEKNYRVDNGKILNKLNEVVFCVDIIHILHIIFSQPKDDVAYIINSWLSKFLNRKEIKDVWGVKTFYFDYIELGLNISFENEFNHVNVLIKEINKEIKSDVFGKLINKNLNFKEFKELIRCFGYEFSDTIVYNPVDFTPRYFVNTITYDDMMKARFLSDIYQDLNLQN